MHGWGLNGQRARVLWSENQTKTVTVLPCILEPGLFYSWLYYYHFNLHSSQQGITHEMVSKDETSLESQYHSEFPTHATRVCQKPLICETFVYICIDIIDWLIDWLYKRFTAHQHQKGHTVPKQVSPLDDDDDITESTRKTRLWFYSLRTALSKNCTVWEHSLSGQVWTKCPTRPDTQGAPQGGCSLHPCIDIIIGCLANQTAQPLPYTLFRLQKTLVRLYDPRITKCLSSLFRPAKRSTMGAWFLFRCFKTIRQANSVHKMLQRGNGGITKLLLVWFIRIMTHTWAYLDEPWWVQMNIVLTFAIVQVNQSNTTTKSWNGLVSQTT